MRTARFHLLHMLTGVLIAVFLGIHIVVLHLDTILGVFGVSITDPTSWQSMIDRATQGAWAGIYITLLAVALYHALYGLRGILLEVMPSVKAGRAVTLIFVIVGIIIFAWGTYVPVALLSS